MAKYKVTTADGQSYIVETQDDSAAQTAAPAERSPNYFDYRDALAQGLTFGFGDEAAAGLGAVGDLLTGDTNVRQNYARRVAQERANLKDTETRFPGLSLGMNVLGSLPTMYVPGLNAAKGATLWKTLGNAARTGALSGAISGAGAAEGGIAERAAGAGKGAALGGLVGGAVPPLGRLASGLTQRLADATADSWVGRGLGKIPGILPPGGQRGAEKVLSAFEKDEMSPIQIGMELDRLSVADKPAVLADVGRSMTRRLARDVINAGPRGTADAVETLAARSDEAGARVAEDLVSTTGLRGDAQEVANALMKQRATTAAPLYAAAYRAGGGPITDDVVLGLLRLPEFRQAVNAGYKLAAVEGVALPPPQRSAKGTYVRLPNLQVLDYVKRGLDDILYSGKRTGTIGKGMLRALEKRRDEFVGRLDELYPEYVRARDTYAGDTRMLEAIDLGKKFASSFPGDIKSTLRKLSSQGEREFYLLGAVDSMKQAIASSPDGADIVRRVFGVKAKRDILESLFPSKEAYLDFANRISAEKSMRMTTDAVRGNSTTAQQAAGLADLGDDAVLRAIPQVAAGNYTGWLSGLLPRGRGNLGANAEAALPILFGDPRKGLEQLVRARQSAEAPIRSSVPLGVASGLLSGR